MICASENNEYVKVGMINAYKSVHWGSGIISNHQNSYLMFNEKGFATVCAGDYLPATSAL